jgi:hypothetical protein
MIIAVEDRKVNVLGGKRDNRKEIRSDVFDSDGYDIHFFWG